MSKYLPMRDAELVIGQQRKLINADEADYSDFKRLFKCSECNEIVKLRTGYWRSSHQGNKPVWVRSTFVHDKRQLKDCSKRNSFGLPDENDAFDLIARGQSTPRLEKALLTCFDSSLKGDAGSRVHSDQKQPYSHYGWLSHISLNTYVKRYTDYNRIPGRVHEKPELLCEALSRIFSSPQADDLIDHYIKALPPKIIAAQSEEYLIKKAIVTSTQITQLVNQHCLQLASLLDYLRSGAQERVKKKFLFSLLWVDAENLPILPHEIETIEARVFREGELTLSEYYFYRNKSAKAKYLEQEKKKQSIQIEEDRRSYIERIRQFSESFLLDIVYNRNSSVDEAFEDFRRDNLSRGYDIVKFLLDRLIFSTSRTNWEKLPIFYDCLNMRRAYWEESWMTSEDLKEEMRKRAKLSLRKKVELPLQNGEQLVKVVRSSQR